ncbi:MAG: FAD-binding oxidoreductase, partial [Acidobacteriota bacterium]|nr:FAD-binding oxidoreductase [Acidobacteriota bacterium]
MPATSTAGSRLADISGAASVITDPARLAAYEVHGKAPLAAVQPASREAVPEIVKFCVSEKLSVIPCGARSKLRMGGTPERYDVALDVSRLDRVIAYDPDDLTLSVEAGIPLQRLAGVLAGHRQFVPLEVPFLSQATAGGTIASGVHSPLRQAYGTARDFLLGIEVVTGEGARAKSGGLVVKNVAGYDLHKLMIGAMGTLGIITSMNFRTFPAPAPRRIFSAVFRSAESALDLRSRVGQSHLRPLTMDVLNPTAVEMLAGSAAARFEAGPAPVDRLPSDKWAFLAMYSGKGAVA